MSLTLVVGERQQTSQPSLRRLPHRYLRNPNLRPWLSDVTEVQETNAPSARDPHCDPPQATFNHLHTYVTRHTCPPRSSCRYHTDVSRRPPPDAPWSSSRRRIRCHFGHSCTHACTEGGPPDSCNTCCPCTRARPPGCRPGRNSNTAVSLWATASSTYIITAPAAIVGVGSEVDALEVAPHPPGLSLSRGTARLHVAGVLGVGGVVGTVVIVGVTPGKGITSGPGARDGWRGPRHGGWV
jgi:hypothetical protein